jgi:hypothetical protein
MQMNSKAFADIPGPHFCERCGEKLDASKSVWLDLNLNTGLYRVETWPEAESQGAFAFGAACAKSVLKNGGQCVHIGLAAR